MTLTRAPLLRPMTYREELVCRLLAVTGDYVKVARLLRIEPRTAKAHAERAATKIPGNLPAQMRVIAWARGAALEVLTGEWVQNETSLRLTAPDAS